MALLSHAADTAKNLRLTDGSSIMKKLVLAALLAPLLSVLLPQRKSILAFQPPITL